MADSLELTVQIVAAHVAKNKVENGQLPELIRSVFDALNGAGKPAEQALEKVPAVPIQKSVFDDHIVCLECGGHFRVLKRHVLAHHSMTIEQYRQLYRLPRSYPMVAADYANERARVAKKIGLGRKGSERWKKKRG